MQRKIKTLYDPPRVLQQADVCPEQSFLTGSVIDNFNLGGIYTPFQVVEQKDFETDDFNFSWE